LEILLLGGGVKQNNYNPLRINVGFILHESVGFSRKIEFDEPTVQVADDVDVSHLQGGINFTRTTQGIYAQGSLKATIPMECDRCLSEYDQTLSVEVNDLFVYPPSKATDPLLVVPETGILDLTGLLREYLILEIPIHPLCRADCPGLCVICGNKLGEEKCDHPEMEVDPRLAILQSLLPDSRNQSRP
jgi:uncharacterized protein